VACCLDHRLKATAERLAPLRPEWRELLVGRSKEPRGFLLDSWESIRGRLGAIVDPDDVVPMFGASDFLPADLHRKRATDVRSRRKVMVVTTGATTGGSPPLSQPFHNLARQP
jgi:hypothetical protein